MIPTLPPHPSSVPKVAFLKVWGRNVKSCKNSREVTQEQHVKGDASARGGERKGAAVLCPLRLTHVVSPNLLCSL